VTKGICIPNESLYLNQDIQKIILKKFNGILFAGCQEGNAFWLANRKALKYSMTLNGDYKTQFPELTPYIDEPISNPTTDNKKWNFVRILFGDTIIGELAHFHKLNCNITYTAYRDILFSLFGIRVYKFWGNQIKTWQELHNKYGKRFNICWISIKENENDYDELIKWATTYNKAIWFYVQDGLQTDEIINQINKLKL
jgi:hypothetical protein